MVADDLPLLAPSATMREAVVHLAERRGIVMIAESGRLVGVVTTGDLSRLLERTTDIWGTSVSEIMTRSPKHAKDDELGSAVVYRMQQHGIMAMPVLNGAGAIAGVVHLHDLMRSGAA
jgi:arabinose-5-phosphate isomerase